MPQNKLKINRPSLSANWTPEQMRAGAVRIHNRFAALLTSVIESADWANYRQTKRPLEVGRPAWPDPGEYCDLVLQRRNGPAEVALDVVRDADRGSARATRAALLDASDGTTPFDMLVAERFEEARAALGQGPGRVAPALAELSAAAKAERKPLPPEELFDAKSERVHREPGRARAARTVRNKRRGSS